MSDTNWDRRTIELPPGWHDLIKELKNEAQPTLKMKYIYTLAVEQMLAGGDVEAIVEGAWKLERECREDLSAVENRHAKAFRAAIERYRKKRRAKP